MKNSSKAESRASVQSVSAELVSEYLEQNPGFFHSHEDLLEKLALPHQQGQSVSLVERQMSILRAKNTELRHRLDQLIGIASSNDQLFSKCRNLTISLIEASNTNQFFSVISDSLTNDFSCDAASMVLIDSKISTKHPLVILTSSNELELSIPGIAQSHKPVLGVMRPKELGFLFRDESDFIESAVAVPLYADAPLGILAVGSKEPNHFSASLDTMFLEFIVEVLVEPRFQDVDQ